ncbi:MAG: DUF4469 domain-containing protein [Chloroflexi bacterium]|nr:DUF4469 domain-containing protein [Chloroflexota bacterium]
MTNGKGFFRAIVLSRRTCDLNNIIDRMVEQGTTLTRQDIIAVLDLFFNTVMLLILEGCNVLTPVFNLGVSIKGNFDSQNDTFDASRHRVEPRVNANAQFKRRLQMTAKVQQQKANRPMPQPEEYINPNNGDDNSVLTPGGGAKLRGHALQFDPEDTGQGIFLIAEDQSRTRIEGCCTTLSANSSSWFLTIWPPENTRSRSAPALAARIFGPVSWKRRSVCLKTDKAPS